MDAEADPTTDTGPAWVRPALAKVLIVALGLIGFLVTIWLLREAVRGMVDHNLATPEGVAQDAVVSTAVAVGSAAAIALSFWLIYPVTGYLRIAELIPRVLVAAAIATLVVLLVGFFVQWAVYGPDTYQGNEWDYLLRGAADSVPEVLVRVPLVFVAALALRELDWREHDRDESANQSGARDGEA